VDVSLDVLLHVERREAALGGSRRGTITRKTGVVVVADGLFVEAFQDFVLLPTETLEPVSHHLHHLALDFGA
jgi:hypothetical protein